MTYNTLQLYLIAGGASMVLAALLLALTRYKPNSHLLKRGAATVLLMAAAFSVSGFGPELPRWMTVMGTNMAFLASTLVIYPGLVAYCKQHLPADTHRHAQPDWLGWGVVAATALPFWYWGLVDPNGHARSAVFSFAVAALNARNARLLLTEAWRQRRNHALWGIAILLCSVAVWMLARGGLYVLMDAPPAAERGSNPTQWTTVAAMIGVLSALSMCVTWLEFKPQVGARPHKGAATRSATRISQADFVRNKLMLLWSTVVIVSISLITEAALVYTQVVAWEHQRQLQISQLANVANLNHTQQVLKQVDTVLQAVRGYYQRTQSAAETEAFINSLPFDKTVIDNIYLAGADAKLLIAHNPTAVGLSLADRTYTSYHLTNQSDSLHISAVEAGRVTGQNHFRATRRITGPEGNFAGLVIATVNPQALSDYYSQQMNGPQNVTALFGTYDQKFRAVAPNNPAPDWNEPVRSPLWQALEQATSGSYRNISVTDGLERVFVYEKLDGLPLVVATGYTEADLNEGIYRRLRWGGLTLCLIIGGVLVMAALLTIEIRRREEQNAFMSMLSHELRTPLSVIRMSLSGTGALSARTREHVAHAVQDVDAIVTRCLQADRLGTRGSPVTEQACHIKDLLDNIVTASPEPDRLKVTVGDLPNLHTDPQLLSIALSNLVDNALKYAPPEATVTVDAQPHALGRQAGVLLRIANPEGSAGMPDAQHLFKKYRRGPRAHRSTGSGLGLYIVRSVASKLGGWVRYAPKDQMVCFELWLPLKS